MLRAYRVRRWALRETGLDRYSYALCHEVATGRVERLRREIGVLSAPRLA